MRKRKQPEAPPPKVEVQKQEGIITQEREYKLITPLFGGGAVTGAPDEVTVIRGTEIRGHLRFWWRACYGGRYATVKEMKEDEDRIWGAAAKKDAKIKGKAGEQEDEDNGQKEMTVQIMVKVLNKGTEVEPFRIITAEQYAKERNRPKSKRNYWESPYDRNSGVPAYAAFSLQLTNDEKQREKRPTSKMVYENIQFRLTLSFSKEIHQNKTTQKDIEGTLWAWETFGGIGARTRRGFGALHLDKAQCIEIVNGIENRKSILQARPIADEKIVKKWITDKFAEFGIENKAPLEVPSLSSDMQPEVINIGKTVEKTWDELINILFNFRQMRIKNSNRSGNVGRSKWPEAEAVRDCIGRGAYESLSHPQKFPRSAFGLPIVFHFKDSGDGPEFDPHDSTLQGIKKGHDRLASPLILRPLLCNGNNAVGLAMVLKNAFLPEELLLKEEDGESYYVKPHIDHQEATKVEPLAGQTDVLQAFMNYLRGK